MFVEASGPFSPQGLEPKAQKISSALSTANIKADLDTRCIVSKYSDPIPCRVDIEILPNMHLEMKRLPSYPHFHET